MALKSGWKWLKTWPFHTHSLDRAERKCSMDCHYPKENWWISRILNPAIELSSMNDIYRYWSKNQFPINALLRVLWLFFEVFGTWEVALEETKLLFQFRSPFDVKSSPPRRCFDLQIIILVSKDLGRRRLAHDKLAQNSIAWFIRTANFSKIDANTTPR